MKRARVLFLSTGGTLGMLKRDPGPLAPSHVAENILPWVRGLEEEIDISGELLYNLDSSDITPAHWERIGAVITARRADYDGFVVLHGTDTMAYTACALSYMLRGLDRPVVLTGAQRPIAYVRTDARSNLIHSALCAAMDLPEVGVFFGRALFRGNRATKTSIQSYEAFESPNFPPLVKMGVEVLYPVPHRQPTEPFSFQPGFCTDVDVLTILPGSSPRLLDLTVERGARGVLLRGFGAGNIPQTGWPERIRAATDAGVPVALQSQCLRGTVSLHSYQGGRAALDSGALSTGAMTLEAAVVKLMYLIGQGLSGDGLAAAYATDLSGEGAS